MLMVLCKLKKVSFFFSTQPSQLNFLPHLIIALDTGSPLGTVLLPSLPTCRGHLARSGDNVVVTLGEGAPTGI